MRREVAPEEENKKDMRVCKLANQGELRCLSQIFFPQVRELNP